MARTETGLKRRQIGKIQFPAARVNPLSETERGSIMRKSDDHDTEQATGGKNSRCWSRSVDTVVLETQKPSQPHTAIEFIRF